MHPINDMVVYLKHWYFATVYKLKGRKDDD